MADRAGTTSGDRHAAAGSGLFSPGQWKAVGDSLGLSPRQCEIIRAIIDDQTEAEIAGRLGLAPSTVHAHIQRIHKKLDVRSQKALLTRVFAEHVRRERASRDGEKTDARPPGGSRSES